MNGPPRILVVEDDETIRHVLVTALQDEGYQVQQAVNGLLALESVATDRPDVVVLDLMLPVLDGIGFLEQAQVRGLSNGLPVVVLSASRNAQAATANYPACVATVAKPFDLGRLLDTLERAVTSPGSGFEA